MLTVSSIATAQETIPIECKPAIEELSAMCYKAIDEADKMLTKQWDAIRYYEWQIGNLENSQDELSKSFNRLSKIHEEVKNQNIVYGVVGLSIGVILGVYLAK